MRKFHRLLAVAASFVLMMSAVATASAYAPPRDTPGAGINHFSDNIPSPLSEKQDALRQEAQDMVLTGKATPSGDNKVVRVAKGQYVQLAFQGEDQILTLLGQFGEASDPTYGGTAGPLHNQIPQPDRTVDNTTIWTSDFSRPYYQNLLFNKSQVPSMANWYLAQSAGRYSVNGYVSDWVDVANNEAYYGSDYCGDIVCQQTWLFLHDQANAWWAELVAEKGEAGAKAFLSTFDQWDRYDYNGDGNVNQPDGYIDHFQSVHAGEGQETGGGAQGSDAIWSHRWYAFFQNIGADGPAFNELGGIQIGDSGYWIGDYTIEPENGGVGVFSHEFGHDLGLPDEYDTSGNTGGAENSTAWWTEWSQGSYGTISEDLGSYPVDTTAWEKYQLGWLDYGVVSAGQKASFRLGPVESNTKQTQGVFVVLPKKNVTREVGAPYAGSNFYYSGAANNLDTTMTRSVTLPAGLVELTAKVRWNIETGYDYAYLTVNGNKIPTSVSNSSIVPEGIDGVQAAWTDLTADLSAYAGQTVTIGFGYFTDGGVQGATGTFPAGISIDEIAIPGQLTDGAETDAGWTYETNSATGTGFHVSTGSETFQYSNYYVVENRQYMGYDKALKSGPYNFDDPSGNYVTHFPYQDGMLVWYWDTSYSDNNVGDHPGEGLILPIDAHSGIMHYTNGAVARVRLQSYDSTFTLDPTDAFVLHSTAFGTLNFPSEPAVKVFDDSNSYWTTSDPGDALGHYQAGWISVNNPHTGTTIRLKSVSATGFMQIDFNK